MNFSSKEKVGRGSRIRRLTFMLKSYPPNALPLQIYWFGSDSPLLTK
jgi:hypothetical protein